MSVSGHVLTVTERGEVEIPASILERHGWSAGTALVALDSDLGMLVMSVDEGIGWLRARISDRDLVSDLCDERRVEASSGE